MSRFLIAVLAGLFMLPVQGESAAPIDLSEASYKADAGVILIQVNWGRSWRCGRYENAQIHAMRFTRSPFDSAASESLELETPSRLAVDNKFLPYAYVVPPGEYALSGFDVKVARSESDVGHIAASKEKLLKDGKAVGGTFSVGGGEVVYIGHFGIDCGAEPFLWRYYIESRNDFERYVVGFRKKFPFLKAVPVRYRLFSTEVLGRPFELQDGVVK